MSRLVRFFGSRWFLYIYALFVPFFFQFVLLPYWVSVKVIPLDYAVNLFAEIWGIIYTIIFLVILFELREILVWRKVKDKVFERIGREIQAIFNLVVYFVDITDLKELKTLFDSPNGDLPRKVFLAKLQGLNDRKEIRLDKKGRDELSKGRYLETFEVRRKYLDEIETKYSKFMDPALVSSLMEIQNNLQGITIDLSELLMYRTYGDYVDIILKKIATKMQVIVKEIHLIYERREIEIYH